jgi:hypothetical protein
VIEALDDGEWPDPPAELEEVGAGAKRSSDTSPGGARKPSSIKLGPPPKPPLGPRVALVRDRAEDADPEGGTGKG